MVVQRWKTGNHLFAVLVIKKMHFRYSCHCIIPYKIVSLSLIHLDLWKSGGYKNDSFAAVRNADDEQSQQSMRER